MISTSSNIIFADFPPNYKVILFKLVTCDYFIILYPTYVEPVKATLLTKLCFAKKDPVLPAPDIMLITPFGNPAWLIRWPNLRAVKGVC